MSTINDTVQHERERDPGQFLRALAALKAACALYPEGHPSIDAHVDESFQRVQELITDNSRVGIYINNLLDEEIFEYRRSRYRSEAGWVQQYNYYGAERNVSVRFDFDF